MLAAGAVAYVEDLLGAMARDSAARSQLLLLLLVAFALPGDQDAIWLQERGCELGEGREAAHGAGGDAS